MCVCLDCLTVGLWHPPANPPCTQSSMRWSIVLSVSVVVCGVRGVRATVAEGVSAQLVSATVEPTTPGQLTPLTLTSLTWQRTPFSQVRPLPSFCHATPNCTRSLTRYPLTFTNLLFLLARNDDTRTPESPNHTDSLSLTAMLPPTLPAGVGSPRRCCTTLRG